jgi:hypothetical protein
MEPVFMILGQSAATAATLSIEGKTSVQLLRYDTLRARLAADKQVLEWGAPTSSSKAPETGAGGANPKPEGGRPKEIRSQKAESKAAPAQ